MASSWESLPPHVHELILAHLPLSVLPRLRLLSHAWLAALSSPSFLLLHRRLHPRLGPSFLFYNHAVKFSALLPPPSDLDPAPPPLWRDLPVPAPFVRELVGDGRSLVCLRSHATSGAFTVGHVASGQWTTLPDPPRAPLLSKLWAAVAQTSQAGSSAYFIVLLQLDSPTQYIDVYNSEKKAWTQRNLPRAPHGKGFLVTFSSNAVVIDGFVYSVQAESRSVVSYDVRGDKWKTLEARLPDDMVLQAPKEGGFIQVTPQVMQGCKGKLLLVGAAAQPMSAPSSASDGGLEERTEGAGLDEGGKGINFAVVWELDWGSRQWREMVRAPWEMCKEMMEEAMDWRKSSVTPVKYSGSAELVVAMAAGSQRALRFDAIEEKWEWLRLPEAVNCELCVCFDKPIF